MASWLLHRARDLVMIDALFIQPAYSGAKSMLDTTALRHEAIATNLANLETPSYRRVDLAPSFASELRQAVVSGDTARLGGLRPRLEVDETATAANRDGNTVQLESELLALSQNTTEHTLETQLVTSHLLKLRLAITGRPA